MCSYFVIVIVVASSLIDLRRLPSPQKYEICAAMLLSEDEFFENKSQIVKEVLAKLHQYARSEAELLFREFENYGGRLLGSLDFWVTRNSFDKLSH